MKRFLITFILAAMALPSLAQIKVTGKITSSEDGSPVPFAYVVVKGTQTGTSSDDVGLYSLDKVAKNAVLVVSSIGFTTLEVPVDGRAVVDIILNPDTNLLEQSMVVAYGTATKSSFTGAAGVVSGDKIANNPATNPLNTLNGSVPGVRLTSALGQPGADASITVRGIGSINGNTDPLIVMDGMIYSGNINSIPAEDIESLTVLKDAASTALYGARAANGVIMITTRQGKSEKSSIDVKIAAGFVTREQRDIETLGIADYLETYWRIYYNNNVLAGQDPAIAGSNAATSVIAGLNFSEDYNPWSVPIGQVLSADGKYNPNAQFRLNDTNWREGIEQVGYVQKYSISSSGRAGKNTYFASVGYQDQQGYIVGSGFSRYNARVNVATQPTKNVKFGVNLSASLSNRYGMQSTSQGDMSNVFLIARRMPPVYAYTMQRPDGSYIYNSAGEKIYDFGEGFVAEDGTVVPSRKVYSTVNPIRQLQNRQNDQRRTNFDAKPYVEIRFLKDFKFTANGAVYNGNYKAHSATIYYEEKSANTPSTTITNTQTQTFSFNQLLNWNHDFGKHNVEALLGHESNEWDYWNNTASKRYQVIVGDNYEFDNYTETSSEPSSYHNEYNTEGYFARANYSYDEKYFFSASFRRDGSSRFSASSRWGNFWSVGGSWVLSREEFIKNKNWINFLKFRASIGTVGSDDLGSYYPYMALYEMNKNVDEPGYTQSTTSTGNPDLQWEVSTNWDAAVEFTLFDSRLNGSLEYFHRMTSNLLMEVTLPSSSGLTSRNENAGTLLNAGLEFGFDYDLFKTRNFTWNIGVNGSVLKNKIVSLPCPAYNMNSNFNRVEEGHSVYEWNLYQWAGVDPDTGLSLYELSDNYLEGDHSGAGFVTKDGKVYTTDLGKAKEDFSGSSVPRVFGGFNTALRWKNLSLNLDFYYQLGGVTYDTVYERSMSYFVTTEFMNLNADVLKSWKQPGDVTDIPMLTNSTYASNVQGLRSSRWITTTNLLELNSASISYDIPKKACQALTLKKAQVYVAADHLFILNARRGLNAMYSLSGYNSGGDRYSPSRTISVGLNLTF